MAIPSDRYTPVLILGSGVAGLSCALRLAEAGRRVTLVCKDELASGSTLFAQGGISAVLGKDDSLQAHVQDTRIAGAGLCDEAAVRYTVAHGAQVIHWLLDRGVAFTRDPDDTEGERLHLTREGGHSFRRIAHAADTTGRTVATTLSDLVREHAHIDVLEHHFAMDLALDDTGKRVIGAWLLDTDRGNTLAMAANAVVLATGGANQTYLHLSNPQGSSGDGIAMAWRAGCRVANMEFMQFHPTGLYCPGRQAFLISEALRGEGARLTLPDGQRFMDRFDARAELAPRDIVARAIEHEMQRLGLTHVLLDITHRGPEFIRSHFPAITAHCREVGIDITREPIPVTPIAHFTCGGVTTDLAARTDLEGLYAIGEVACTGLHGANRMASNSLLECLVFAQAAADDLCAQPPTASASHALPPTPATVPDPDPQQAAEAEQTLRKAMWQNVGIVRSNQRLAMAAQCIDRLQAETETECLPRTGNVQRLELRNLLTTAHLIVRSARARHESRGLHYTLDYPETSPTARPTVLDPKRPMRHDLPTTSVGEASGDL